MRNSKPRSIPAILISCVMALMVTTQAHGSSPTIVDDVMGIIKDQEMKIPNNTTLSFLGEDDEGMPCEIQAATNEGGWVSYLNITGHFSGYDDVFSSKLEDIAEGLKYGNVDLLEGQIPTDIEYRAHVFHAGITLRSFRDDSYGEVKLYGYTLENLQSATFITNGLSTGLNWTCSNLQQIGEEAGF